MASTSACLVLLLALAGPCLAEADGQGECGPFVVPLRTQNSKPCTLSFKRDDLDVSDAELNEEVRKGLEKARKVMGQLLQREQRITEEESVPLSTPEYHHYLTNMATDAERQQAESMLEDFANATELAHHLCRKYEIPPHAMGDFLISLKVRANASHVLQVPTCNASDIYRTYNASCNNLDFPTWGMTDTAYTHFTTPKYHDGIHVPRKSVTGKELPNPEALRMYLLPNGHYNDKTLSLITMQFGQLIAHDTALSADWVGPDGLGIECCNKKAKPLPRKDLSVGCYPVIIPKENKYYAEKGVRCMSVARSMKKFTTGGFLGAAFGFNSVNHLLDCSFVYGFDKDQADQLREFKKGRLRTQTLPDGREVLPQAENPMQSCSLHDNGTCFVAGDPRCNQNTELTVLQIMFLRFHNSKAHELSSLNPHWDDEKIYQEARRICTASYVHIIYNEYLQEVLREEWLEKFHLLPSKTGYSNCYNASINPATNIEFTHMTFRRFHTTAQSDLLMYKDIGCPVGKVKIGAWMDKPEILVKDDNLNKFVRGLTEQHAMKLDKWTAKELTTNLFRVDQPYGQDLHMFDMIRGRDNGLATYNDMREKCGLPRAKTFEDFCDLMSHEDAMALSHFYEHPDDVDLAMAMLEKTDRDILGVWEILMMEQFYRWKCGDRFFYDYSGSPYPFTEDQINEIKKITLSRVLCDNADNITRIQQNSFQVVSSTNPVMNCTELPAVDLSYWKEEK